MLALVFPMYQSAFVAEDETTQRHVVERGVSCYVLMYVAGVVVIAILFAGADDF